MKLSELAIGECARVRGILIGGHIRRRLLDLGVVKFAYVKALYKDSSGELTAYELSNTVFALRAEDASQIIVELQSK